ncbi:hypothetical protein K1T71_008264 [Dendrolimus kikuchii]|uniref:Uncharacterized protein n=1 Tax=Dendrolimus kikuchii TaxID=765133 RepID=A0ACC1CX78_9NEOP|nr:hypothetical protein K1T71_008264 [Dendrolimus kikuchii]
MLSTSEALHCGVPIVSIPLFSDQFANAASALENGLGVTVDIGVIVQSTIGYALLVVLQESYQRRVKYISEMWRDRPLSPIDTAVYWIEYVAKYKGDVRMKPPTVNLLNW